MHLDVVNEIIKLCKDNGIRRFRNDCCEIEFFDSKPETMSLTPQDLSKVLTDSLPPDSTMLFASSEDIEENLNPSQGKDAT